MKKSQLMVIGFCFAMCATGTLSATTIVFEGTPRVIQNAALREAMRQDSTWTAENIQKEPYLFLQDQIASCNKLTAKMDAQNITLVRMAKTAKRKADDAKATITRFERFLNAAKEAYQSANGEFPVFVNGYELSEDELANRINDAMDRIAAAKEEQSYNQKLCKKLELRRKALQEKKRELSSLRIKLTQQAEQVKTNSALAEFGDLKTTLDTISDMMLDVEKDPSEMSLDDLTQEDETSAKQKRAFDFLKK